MGNRPVFNARFISALSFDRLYRVYAAGDQLFFIRIGGQGGLREGLVHSLGLVGFLVESSIRKRADRREKALIEAIDRASPEELLPRHKDNFRLGAAEVQDGTVDPPSFLATHGPHVGRWQLSLRDGRKMTFQFESIEDLRSALDVLPDLFPSGQRVNVRWNPAVGKYEKREDAA